MTRLRVGAGLGALLGLVLFVAGQTTGAFWADSDNAEAGTVHTGTLELVNGDAVTQVHDYDFAALSAENMSPGSFAQAPLTLANAGTSDLRYRLQAWTATSADLRDSLELSVTVVGAASDCPAAHSGSQPGDAIDPEAGRLLAPDDTEVWCIRLTLDPSAPDGLASSDADSVTFEFRGEQARNA